MRTKLWLASKFLISVLVLVGGAIPVSATSCDTNIPNSCTGSIGSGSDTADLNIFNGNNSDLTFSNITFDSATGTYTTAEGLDSTTATGSALLYGVSFIGCISNQSPCISNSGLTVENFAGWNGGTDTALTGPSAVGSFTPVTITVILPANVFAFGVDILNTNNYNNAPFLITLPGNAPTSTATSVNMPGSVFYGYRSASAISQVTIYGQFGSTQLGIDNFELGTVTPTSEVGTMLLVASGLLGLRFSRRYTA